MTKPQKKPNSRTIEVGKLFRDFKVDARAIDEEARTLTLTFSSEEPVDRWFGKEILSHAPGAVRLGRLQSGRAPLLIDHINSVEKQPGVIEKAEVGADGIGRATVRFGKDAFSDSVFARVKDGIVSCVSVGYRIFRAVLEEENEDGPDVYRVMDWEPFEVSLVSVPADMTVGVERKDDGEKYPVEIINLNRTMEKKPMEPNVNTPAATPAPAVRAPEINVNDAVEKALVARNAEVSRMVELGKRFDANDLAQKFINERKSSEELLDAILEGKPGVTKIRTEDADPRIGLSDKEAKAFSFRKAMLAMITNDWRNAGFEREVSEATQERYKERKFSGVAVPVDVMLAGNARISDGIRTGEIQGNFRNMTTAALQSGGYMVGNDHLGGSFIEVLRARTLLTQLGVRFLSGLVGNVVIPKATGGTTAYWVNEASEITKSDLATGQVTLSPKTLAARTVVSHKLLKQASPDVEAFLRVDMATALANKLEAAAYGGSGAGAEPLGILNTTGIGSITIGTSPTFGKIVDMESEVANDNALAGDLHYVFSSSTAGKLKQTVKASNFPAYIWENGEVNGYPAHRTTLMTSGKGIFGNFSDLVIGEWGAVDLMLDNSQVASLLQGFILAEEVDLAVRHAESFCEGKES